MYCILKILNNNALLAKEKDSGNERILLGKESDLEKGQETG